MSAKVSALLELATASVAMVVFGDVACVPLLPLLLQRAESAAPPLALAGKGCVSETTPGRAMSMRCCCGVAEHITLGSHSWTTIGLSMRGCDKNGCVFKSHFERVPASVAVFACVFRSKLLGSGACRQ